MKKTLITLAALALVSVASAEWTDTPQISATNPVWTDSFTFSFMLTEDVASDLTSSNTLIAAYSQSQAAATSHTQGVVAFFLSKGSEGYTFTLDNCAIKEENGQWVKAWDGVTATSWTGSLALNTVYTVTGSSSTGDPLAVTISSSTGQVATLSINGKMNHNTTTVGTDMWTYFNSNYTTTPTPAVPEPATATLSLLALAGLAARRRRK